jgi:site-specific DNA-methyltransferase (adenine-specific)
VVTTRVKPSLRKPQRFTLYNGDCIEVLNSFDSESVDLIFADPPYNLSNGGTSVHAGKRVSVNKGSWDKSNGISEDHEFHSQWIAACKRVLKPNGTMWISGTYHNIYSCGFALQQQGWRILNEITWFKPNGAPNLGCRMFTASHETLIWASQGKSATHIFNYLSMKNGSFEGDVLKKPNKQMRSVWSIPTPSKSEKEFGKHPTQKPIALLNRIIHASASKGMIVLDPFCGSGTTGVAALTHGCKFIGIDSDSRYLTEIAYPRLLKASSHGRS